MGRGELEPGADDARRMAEELRGHGCRVELVQYPGVGHGLPDPPWVELERILEFLGSVEEPGQ
jgi:dipeptidyl aminopeptidase/acylaminoacyl peptidase